MNIFFIDPAKFIWLWKESYFIKGFPYKRAKSKLDTGKKKRIVDQENNNSESNISQESIFEEKKDIPLELYFLLLEYQNKFLKENTKFQTIKNYNDEVLSF